MPFWRTKDLELYNADRVTHEVKPNNLCDGQAEGTGHDVNTEDGVFTIKPSPDSGGEQKGEYIDERTKSCPYGSINGLPLHLLHRIQTFRSIQTFTACCLVLPQDDTLRFHITKYKPCGCEALRRNTSNEDYWTVGMKKNEADKLLF